MGNWLGQVQRASRSRTWNAMGGGQTRTSCTVIRTSRGVTHVIRTAPRSTHGHDCVGSAGQGSRMTPAAVGRGRGQM